MKFTRTFLFGVVFSSLFLFTTLTAQIVTMDNVSGAYNPNALIADGATTQTFHIRLNNNKLSMEAICPISP